MFGLRACNVLSGILRMVTRWLRPPSRLARAFSYYSNCFRDLQISAGNCVTGHEGD